MLVPDKTGTKPINLERYFVFVQIRKHSQSALREKIVTFRKKKPRMILRCEQSEFTFPCFL